MVNIIPVHQADHIDEQTSTSIAFNYTMEVTTAQIQALLRALGHPDPASVTGQMQPYPSPQLEQSVRSEISAASSSDSLQDRCEQQVAIPAGQKRKRDAEEEEVESDQSRLAPSLRDGQVEIDPKDRQDALEDGVDQDTGRIEYPSRSAKSKASASIHSQLTTPVTLRVIKPIPSRYMFWQGFPCERAVR